MILEVLGSVPQELLVFMEEAVSHVLVLNVLQVVLQAFVAVLLVKRVLVVQEVAHVFAGSIEHLLLSRKRVLRFVSEA